jgi:hypothetical protein
MPEATLSAGDGTRAPFHLPGRGHDGAGRGGSASAGPFVEECMRGGHAGPDWGTCRGCSCRSGLAGLSGLPWFRGDCGNSSGGDRPGSAPGRRSPRRSGSSWGGPVLRHGPEPGQGRKPLVLPRPGRVGTPMGERSCRGGRDRPGRPAWPMSRGGFADGRDRRHGSGKRRIRFPWGIIGARPGWRSGADQENSVSLARGKCGRGRCVDAGFGVHVAGRNGVCGEPMHAMPSIPGIRSGRLPVVEPWQGGLTPMAARGGRRGSRGGSPP